MTIQTGFSDIAVLQNNRSQIQQSILGWFKRRYALAQDRRDVRRLLDLNSRLLDDMGLERSDVTWALTAPGKTPPSQRLKALRIQRSRDRLRRLRGRHA